MNYEEIKKQGVLGVESWKKYKNDHYLWSMAIKKGCEIFEG